MHIMQNNQNPDGFKSESGIFKGLFLLLWNKGFECFLAIFFSKSSKILKWAVAIL